MSRIVYKGKSVGDIVVRGTSILVKNKKKKKWHKEYTKLVQFT